MRPVILVGAGCKNNPKLIDQLGSMGIPLLTTWMAIDFYDENHPSFCGRPGIYGQRAANIIQQKADVIVCLGARLDNEQVAYNYENFAPKATKIVMDIDQAELDKFPDSWKKIKVDLSTKWVELAEFNRNDEWMKWCKDLYNQFRSELDQQSSDGYDNPIAFINQLSEICKPDDVLAIGSSGGAALSFVQCFKIKTGQRVTNLSTIGAMGADIPMAIGACMASGKRRTICVTGDGGFFMNIQELEVVTRYQLPIKFFVYNNNGYGSIRSMQNSRFDGHYVGCDPDSGMTLPSLQAIAKAFRIPYFSNFQLSLGNGGIFNWHGAGICELHIDPNYKQYPRVMSQMDEDGKFHWMKMENLEPALDKEEFDKIMSY
jgi:acetolactate synthase-1/2/3 large subunit